MNNKKLGDKYELIACDYLRKKGYKIIEQNFYSRYGEIDIIAYKNDVFVFCEVKYRKNAKYGFPEDFVVKSKQDKIAKTALIYIAKNKIISRYRFDIISILGNRIEQIEEAFIPRKNLSNF